MPLLLALISATSTLLLSNSTVALAVDALRLSEGEAFELRQRQRPRQWSMWSMLEEVRCVNPQHPGPLLTVAATFDTLVDGTLQYDCIDNAYLSSLASRFKLQA